MSANPPTPAPTTDESSTWLWLAAANPAGALVLFWIALHLANDQRSSDSATTRIALIVAIAWVPVAAVAFGIRHWSGRSATGRAAIIAAGFVGTAVAYGLGFVEVVILFLSSM